jgi:hypothetical protein
VSDGSRTLSRGFRVAKPCSSSAPKVRDGPFAGCQAPLLKESQWPGKVSVSPRGLPCDRREAWRGKLPVRSTPTRPRRRPTRRHLIGASRLSCCPSPGVGNGKHRPQPSPSLPPQGGANKQLSDPNSLFAGSVSTRCARRDRPEARRRPRYRKFESIPLQRGVSNEPCRRGRP